MKRIGKLGTMVLLALCSTGIISAQGNPITLRIGDPAPEIKYSRWLKGEPLTSLSGQQLYILEFWATWCGPCKAAMPHLTKLQKEYEGKATFIGVGVWEKVKEGSPYESSLPMVTRYVEGNTANMGYSVVADNNDQYMGNNWLKAAGQNGIPSTFIIKDHKVIWIGHPLALDTTLPRILDGSYDMMAYKGAFDKRVEASQKQMEAWQTATKPVQDALAAKQYEKAFELMEKAKADVPILKISMDNLKFTTLLQHVSPRQAMAFATAWEKEFKNAPQYVLMGVAEEEGLPQSVYLWAAQNFVRANPSTTNPMVSNLLASCYAKGGDFNSAVAHQEKALGEARVALKEGKLVGSIMDYTVTEYEETLAGYKKAVKTAKK